MEKFLVRTNKPTDAPPAAKKLRRYDEAYLQFGFTVTADLRPQCVVCAEVLANDSMKPCKLKRHLETKHAGIKNKPAEYFKRKLDGLHQQQATISVHSTVSKQCLEASYVVAKRIGKLGKPHTIAETLILPAAQDMCRIMIGDSAAAKLGAVPTCPMTQSLENWRHVQWYQRATDRVRKKSPLLRAAAGLIHWYCWAGTAPHLCQVSAGQGDRGGCPVVWPASSVAHYRRSHFHVLDIFIRENGLAWEPMRWPMQVTGRERGLACSRSASRLHLWNGHIACPSRSTSC